jgi:methionyl-tRNA formyltransferase
MPDRSETSPLSPIPAKSKPESQSVVTSSAHPQRLIVMGTGPFAVPSFDALRLAGHEIALVVTKPQPPVKSRKGPPPSPVRTWAEEHDLQLFDPDSINDDAAVARISSVDASLLVVCDYGQILKPAALESATLGGINLHGSLLPAYRGAAPVQWALLSGDRTTGVSVIHMTPRLDGGPILETRTTPISDDETSGELEERLSHLGIDATLQAVDRLSEWDRKSDIGVSQDPAKVTKAPRLKKSDGEIDWGRSAAEIDCHVRGMQPWPQAYTHLQLGADKPPIRLVIREIRTVASGSPDHHPGEILDGDLFCVATADIPIEITRLQPAGKREMKGVDFLRGHKPPPGSRLY